MGDGVCVWGGGGVAGLKVANGNFPGVSGFMADGFDS